MITSGMMLAMNPPATVQTRWDWSNVGFEDPNVMANYDEATAEIARINLKLAKKLAQARRLKVNPKNAEKRKELKAEIERIETDRKTAFAKVGAMQVVYEIGGIEEC